MLDVKNQFVDTDLQLQDDEGLKTGIVLSVLQIHTNYNPSRVTSTAWAKLRNTSLPKTQSYTTSSFQSRSDW